MLANYSYDDYNIHTSKKCILIDKSNLKEITMNNPTDNNEKLMGLLAYLLAPIIGIIILLSDSMKNNPALKRHAVQSIALSVVIFVIALVMSIPVSLACLTPLLIIPQIIYGIQAYQGKDVTIPVVTEFCQKQGWL